MRVRAQRFVRVHRALIRTRALRVFKVVSADRYRGKPGHYLRAAEIGSLRASKEAASQQPCVDRISVSRCGLLTWWDYRRGPRRD